MQEVCFMADLVDLRAKITPLANQVLDAHALARDIDKSEVVRSVLEQWAVKEIHVSTVIVRVTRSEGGTKE